MTFTIPEPALIIGMLLVGPMGTLLLMLGRSWSLRRSKVEKYCRSIVGHTAWHYMKYHVLGKNTLPDTIEHTGPLDYVDLSPACPEEKRTNFTNVFEVKEVFTLGGRVWVLGYTKDGLGHNNTWSLVAGRDLYVLDRRNQ